MGPEAQGKCRRSEDICAKEGEYIDWYGTWCCEGLEDVNGWCVAETDLPSSSPTEVPSPSPTNVPTTYPTDLPSSRPTEVPSPSPTNVPTSSPTDAEYEIKYVLLTEGGYRPCEKPGLRTIIDKVECGKAAFLLGLSKKYPKVTTQSENDRLFGCRMQSFGSPFWLNSKKYPKWAKPASKVHKAICAIEYGQKYVDGGMRTWTH